MVRPGTFQYHHLHLHCGGHGLASGRSGGDGATGKETPLRQRGTAEHQREEGEGEPPGLAARPVKQTAADHEGRQRARGSARLWIPAARIRRLVPVHYVPPRAYPGGAASPLEKLDI